MDPFTWFLIAGAVFIVAVFVRGIARDRRFKRAVKAGHTPDRRAMIDADDIKAAHTSIAEVDRKAMEQHRGPFQGEGLGGLGGSPF